MTIIFSKLPIAIIKYNIYPFIFTKCEICLKEYIFINICKNIQYVTINIEEHGDKFTIQKFNIICYYCINKLLINTKKKKSSYILYE